MPHRYLLSVLLSLGCFSLVAQNNTWNFNFENWADSTIVADTSFYSTKYDRAVHDPATGKIEHWNGPKDAYQRTTDAHDGRYAIVVHQYYSEAEGLLYLGACPFRKSDKACNNYVDTRPVSIQGYYKFVANDSATAKCTVLVTGQSANGNGKLDTLDRQQVLFRRTDRYTPFKIDLRYKNNATPPDSMQLFFNAAAKQVQFNGRNFKAGTCPDEKIYCEFLYLDDISIQFEPLKASATDPADNAEVYPSPAGDCLRINAHHRDYQDISICSMFGKVLKAGLSTSYCNTVGHMASGMYFVVFTDMSGKKYYRRMVKK